MAASISQSEDESAGGIGEFQAEHLSEYCFHLANLFWIETAKSPHKFDRWDRGGLLNVERALRQSPVVYRHFKAGADHGSRVRDNYT